MDQHGPPNYGVPMVTDTTESTKKRGKGKGETLENGNKRSDAVGGSTGVPMTTSLHPSTPHD